MPELTVIVPCYNEGKRLEPLLDLIRANRELDWEWLFVDDGSTDDTASAIQAACTQADGQVRLHALPHNLGKGRAVREGLQQATGELVGFVDADLAASPLDFKAFLADDDLRAGEKVVIGVRLKTHDGKVQRYFRRHLLGRVFQTLVSALTGLHVYDTQCGFKLMSREAGRDLTADMRCDGFCFDVEMLLLADRRGLQIDERPIAWREQGDSSVRLRHMLAMLVDIWRIRSRVRGLPPPEETAAAE